MAKQRIFLVFFTFLLFSSGVEAQETASTFEALQKITPPGWVTQVGGNAFIFRSQDSVPCATVLNVRRPSTQWIYQYVSYRFEEAWTEEKHAKVKVKNAEIDAKREVLYRKYRRTADSYWVKKIYEGMEEPPQTKNKLVFQFRKKHAKLMRKRTQVPDMETKSFAIYIHDNADHMGDLRQDSVHVLPYQWCRDAVARELKRLDP
ncbi:MAG: hypothetical protein AAF570_10990 [Bacteroidota bacterium]